MPRTRKISTQSSPLKRTLDDEYTFNYDITGKKRKNSDSSDSCNGQGQNELESRSPKTTTGDNIKTDPTPSQDEEQDRRDDFATPVSTETDKRNRSLEALFVVTDNELQNISRHEPEIENTTDEKIYIISDMSGVQVNEEQIVFTEKEETLVPKPDTSGTTTAKFHLKSEALEQQGLKLVYTKQASESSIVPYFVDTKNKRSETFTKSQSEVLTPSPMEMPLNILSVGRKRKHPQKPGRHICSYCGRGCAKPSVLEKHLRAHTGERPFPCLDCGFSFKTKSNLYKHCKSRAHALKVSQTESVVEEIVETEANEVEISDEEVTMAESETESASDQEDPERLRMGLSMEEPLTQVQTPSDDPNNLSLQPNFKKRVEVGKLMEWNKNIEKQEKQRTKAMLEAHSQFPIKIAPKNISGLSMDSLQVPDSEPRPRLLSQKSNPEYSVLAAEENLGKLPSLAESSSSIVVSTSARTPGSTKGLSLPVVMSTETKVPSIKTSEPSITITTETVKLPHPRLGREAAQKGLRELEELTTKLNSPSFQGIQISTSFNKLPDESMEVIVHVAKSAQGQVTGKSELKQKIEALVSATSVALATQPTTPTPVITSSPSFNRADSKQGMSSEHIKEHIQHLISANAAIVDMPILDAPRPRARSIFRQTSELPGTLKPDQAKSDPPKISIPNIVSVPLQPLYQSETLSKGKSLSGKPLLSTLSLPSSTDIMKKENLAKKTDQLKKLNEITGSQTLSLTSDITRATSEGIAGFSGLTVPKTNHNQLEKSKTMEEQVSSSASEFKIQIKLSKTQSESGGPVGNLSVGHTSASAPRIPSPIPSITIDRSAGFTPKEMLLQNRSISFDPKILDTNKETENPSIVVQSDIYPLNLYKNVSAEEFSCQQCKDSFKHKETLKLHNLFYCSSEPDRSAKSNPAFEQIQKILIANYFQKGVAGLKRSVSLPDGNVTKVKQLTETEPYKESQPVKQQMLQENTLEKIKLESLKPKSMELKWMEMDNPPLMIPGGPYTVDQTPTDLTKTKYHTVKPAVSTLAPTTPILLAPAGHGFNQSPRILTPTSIPVLLASLQSRPVLLQQSAVLSEPGQVPTTSIFRSSSLAMTSQNLSIPMGTRSLSMGTTSRTPSTPSGSFQAILPNTNVPTTLIGQPMISPTPIFAKNLPISMAETSQSQAVADMKMRLKGKLLLKRSMSAEKSKEGSVIDTMSPGSRTPGTPITAGRLFGDNSKLAQLLTAQAKESQQHSSPAKRPKLGELKQMNSGQLKAVDFTDIDPPASSKLSKSQSSSQADPTGALKKIDLSSTTNSSSILSLQLSKSVEDKVGTVATAILIKEGSLTEGDSNTVQFFTVPVVMAQPFYSYTKGLSSGYRSNLSPGSHSQVITLISPTASKALPGSKTVKELLIQKSQELAKSPSLSHRSFAEALLTPSASAPKALQYDKGVNSNTTQQLREKLSGQVEKSNQLSPRKSDVITPLTPRRSPLHLYGHLIATLRSTTHVSYCCVQRPQPFYVPISTNKKISMYSNWKAAPHNPNPVGLSSKDLLTLYKSRYTSNPVYAEGGNSVPNSIGGFVTHSTYWTYHKQREGQEMKTASHWREREKGEKVSQSTLEKVLTKIRETTPEETRKEPDITKLTRTDTGKREKVCRGGFKTDEEYTYIRGRGRGSYVCETCGIRCRKPSMLKKHIRTHTDHRPYHCRHCKFSFKTKGNLTKHMKSKAHQKKCMELGIVPVPTSVEECQIDDDELAAQMSASKDLWVGVSLEDEDKTDDEDKDGDDDQDVISLGSDDEDDEDAGADFERFNSQAFIEEQQRDAASPVYVAVKTSESNQPALIKITQKGISSRLGTVYGFEGTSYADRALSPDTGSDSTRSQNIDTEIARSLLELSKKAETDDKGEKYTDLGEKKETRLGNLIGALMSRTKPLSGLQPKEDNSVVLDVEPSRSLPMRGSSSTSIIITDADEEDVTTKESKSPASNPTTLSTIKRPRDLFLGVEDQPSRKRFFLPSSPAKTPKESINPQTPLNASILSYLPPCISTKLGASKASTYRGPIIGQLIQQDSVVMTPVVSSAATSGGFPFLFSHPFELLDVLQQPGDNPDNSDTSEKLVQTSGDVTLSNIKSSKEGAVLVQNSGESGSSRQVFYIIDESQMKVSNNQTFENRSSVTCDVCSKSFTDINQLNLHKKIHVVENTLWCDLCRMKFHSQHSLNKHFQSLEHMNRQASVQNETFPSVLKCIHCGIAFGQTDQLSKHLKSRNHFKELEKLGIINQGMYDSLEQTGELNQMDVSDPEIFFRELLLKCDKIKENVSSANTIESRETTLTKVSSVGGFMGNKIILTNQRKGSIGEKQFSQRLDYEKHDGASNERVTVEIKHEPIDIGDIGQRSFVQMDDEEVQIIDPSNRSKTIQSSKEQGDASKKNGPHLCGICRDGFKDVQELRSHIMTHAELRPYVCEYCDAGFTNAQSLNTHLHTHTQERPYVCGRCGDTFTQADDLHLHMSTHSMLLPAKQRDQSKSSLSHINHSNLKTTLSLDQSKFSSATSPLIYQSPLRPTFSLDQSESTKVIDQSSLRFSYSMDHSSASSSLSTHSDQNPLVIDQSNDSIDNNLSQTLQVPVPNQSNSVIITKERGEENKDS
ncbi:uncharacterized protein LOC126823519 [Patella vulgata]|uniref:uncharacterized protein LOC126823519 n=1 Tax=Patella vulgata TaxID=6465 RepID=UPI0024A7F70A|nr:uncharacterized protein LOC126823519 [Patella vulgata]